MFRFTIRDVLWLTVLVALAVAWWLDRRSLESRFAAERLAAEEQFEKALEKSRQQAHLQWQAERIEHEATRRAWEWEKIRRSLSE